MEIDFSVKEYEYEKRSGNLDSEAKGEVKSKKHFPYFMLDKKIIFKPLSKTKPFSTPYFAYSEVVWSTILNYYFDSTIPIYHLATCTGYEEREPKYHNYGTCVESITKENERLVNLYEYFEKHKDSNVDISKYINYCMQYYDYTFFFESELFKDEEVGTEIAKQILYSILRMDQNYHYENVGLIENNGISVAKPIDHEFSTMFLYPDYDIQHLIRFGDYLKKLHEKSIILNNINLICKKYPELISEFKDSLSSMIKDLEKKPIYLEDNNYIKPFNSMDYEEGILRYKEHDIERADKVKVKKKIIPCKKINEHLNEEILASARNLYYTLDK